jgi:hypothetical protein
MSRKKCQLKRFIRRSSPGKRLLKIENDFAATAQNRFFMANYAPIVHFPNWFACRRPWSGT